MRYRLSGLTFVRLAIVCGMSVAVAGCAKAPREPEKEVRNETEVKPAPVAVHIPVIVYSPQQPAEQEPASTEPETPETVDQKPIAPNLLAPPPVVPVFSVPAFAPPEPPAPEPFPVKLQGIKTKEKDAGKEPKKDAGKEPKGEFKVPSEIGGKSFDQWRKEIKAEDPTNRETAMKSITLFGGEKAYEAIDDIITQLNRHTFNNPVDLSVRVNGTMAMSTIFSHKKEPDAKHIKEALALYKKGMKDPQVIMRVRSVQGLPYLGYPAREMLGDAILLSKDVISWEVRNEATKVMVYMARDAKGAVEPKVIAQLKKSAAGGAGQIVPDRSYLVRLTAVQGLGAIGDDGVLVDLRNVIAKDPSKDVRLAAIVSLAMAGKDKALLTLWGLLESKAKETRLVTLQTLASMKLEGDDKKKTLKHLKDHVYEEKEPILNIWTHAAVITIDAAEMKSHVPPIIQKLNATDLPVRLTALQMIAMGGEKSKAYAYPAIVSLLEDKDVKIAIAAMETLVHMHAFEAIPQLVSITKNPKADEHLKDAAENAIDAFKVLKIQVENAAKDKKTPDKK
jgi:HEAT repeat protein